MSVAVERVEFSVGGLVMRGHRFDAPGILGKVPAVVVLHGRGSSETKWIDAGYAIASRGISVLTFDFRGCGRSEGEFGSLCLKDGITDAACAIDFHLRQDRCDSNRLGILGCSFSGYLAALLTRQLCVKSLVVHVPAVYRDSWLEYRYPEIEKMRDEVTRFRESDEVSATDGIHALSEYSGSLLVIAGGNDKVVPRNVTDVYYHHAQRAKCRKIHSVENADHRFSRREWLEETYRVTAEWFEKTL